MDDVGPAFRFGSFALEPSRRSLLRDGAPVTLRARSFDVLALLAARAGHVVAKDAFVAAVWAGRDCSDESLARCISDVRLALGDRDRDMIRTVPSRGYVLALPVTREQPAATTAADEDVPAPIQSVAVMPFRGHGPDAAGLAAAVTDDVQAVLSCAGDFRVLCAPGLDAPEPPPSSARARYHLEGSVRRVEERVRIAASLVEAESRVLLWSHHFDVLHEDLPGVHDEVVAGIVGRLGTELLASEFARIRRLPAASLDARQNVVLAMQRASRQSDADTAEALACLDRALATDPGFARALGMKAWLLVFRAFQGWSAMDASLQAALALSAEARSADNRELWGCLSAGMIGFALRDAEGAVGVLGEAVALSPSSVHAHGLLGIARAFAGEGERGLADIARAVQLSPREPFLVDFDLYRAFAFLQARRSDEGLRTAERAHRLRPGHVYPLILAACCAGHEGHRPLARTLVDRLLALLPVATVAWVEATSPYVRAQDRAWLVDGLARAGLR